MLKLAVVCAGRTSKFGPSRLDSTHNPQ
jgi:hypothetical protein